MDVIEMVDREVVFVLAARIFKFHTSVLLQIDIYVII